MDKFIKNRNFINLSFFIYIAIILKFAVFRDGFLSGGNFFRYNLAPFIEIVELFRNATPYQFGVIFFGNILLFSPFGVFLKYKRLNLTQIFIFSLIFSLMIEVCQLIFKVGIFEIDDLMLNTIGAILGAKIYQIIRVYNYGLEKIKKLYEQSL